MPFLLLMNEMYWREAGLFFHSLRLILAAKCRALVSRWCDTDTVRSSATEIVSAWRRIAMVR
ncbi:hypothetical protein D3C79_1105170 [compost metagenome]